MENADKQTNHTNSFCHCRLQRPDIFKQQDLNPIGLKRQKFKNIKRWKIEFLKYIVISPVILVRNITVHPLSTKRDDQELVPFSLNFVN